MNELALFAGAGGGILGGHLLGWRTVCAVEWDAYAASVLVARQNEGALAPFPIWDDVQTFDGRPWRGRADVVSGGFPCTDISAAGKGAGIDGEASGMWRHMARIVGEVRPRYVFVENSPLLVGRGLARVLGDLAALGYDARWGVLGAADAGAPHQRDRIWIVATDADGERHEIMDQPQQVGGGSVAPDVGSDGQTQHVADATVSRLEGTTGSGVPSEGRTPEQFAGGSEAVADADSPQRQRDERPVGGDAPHADADVSGWWSSEPDVGRVADGVASRVDRLRCIGNGQVPAVAALAWRLLT
jgi:DNA (cytosine-5)-methyltransferase 1